MHMHVDHRIMITRCRFPEDRCLAASLVSLGSSDLEHTLQCNVHLRPDEQPHPRLLRKRVDVYIYSCCY